VVGKFAIVPVLEMTARHFLVEGPTPLVFELRAITIRERFGNP
jgi:hypothetical protein